MDGHYFVSYSRHDGADFVSRLADTLAAGVPAYRLWVDVRELQPWQQGWDEQIAQAIQDCRGLLFVMTPDSVRPTSICRDEWGWALKYKKPVIPLRLGPGAGLPFRLQSRQYIDFDGAFDQGVARLRLFLTQLDGPEGVLRELRFRVADAERDLPRARDDNEAARIQQEMRELSRQIAEQERVVADPEGALTRTDVRIATDIAVQREPERTPSSPVSGVRVVNRPPMDRPSFFQDRHVETEMLAGFLRAEDTRLATVVGRGGVGKTAVVCRLLRGLETGRLPDDLGELPADGIVYLSTRSRHPVSFANLFTDLCALLPPETAEPLLGRYRDPHETPQGLMYALLEAFPSGRTVVLLDNFEDLLDPEPGAITEAALDEGLRALLSAPAHGVKIVITTRFGPRPLLLHEPGRQRRIDLDEGLPHPYAEMLLKARDPDGKLGLRDAPQEQLALARERTRGYPRALEALAGILAADRDSTLAEILDQTARLPDNVVTAIVGEGFLRLDPLAQQVMQALAVFPMPVPPVAVDYLLQPGRPTINSAPVLRRLVNTQFARRDAGRYYLHQVDREYALGRLAPGVLAELRSRGADYFTRVRPPQDKLQTLDDLAPHLAEFEMRFQAGDHDTAAQLLLSIDFAYLMQWGHYRQSIELHSRLAGRVTDPALRASSVYSRGLCHSYIGDFPTAIELLSSALDGFREAGLRENEGTALCGLGTCYADLGQTGKAMSLYEEALSISREIGDREGEAAALGNLGNRHSAAGRIDRAIELYEQVLAIAREVGYQQGEANQLHNLGERYAELGQYDKAMAHCRAALELSTRIGYRLVESAATNNIGRCLAQLGRWPEAIDHQRRAVETADEISSVQFRAEARRGLAEAHLGAGDTAAARAVIDEARTLVYPPSRAGIAVLDGIITLRAGGEAAPAFAEAVTLADQILAHNPADYETLDSKALALAGLALSGRPALVDEARATFRAARAVCAAPGVTAQVSARLATMAPADPTGLLKDL
ncbi:hypothetical protein Ade02nite_73390 [Paractinoplanes deccanensis]|uniref:TIR domain-containing protein n=1 Tax=Paractinoplanes deccanensis TaxID=113561 RepID=A0ABQ3YFA5_9ACTN|nr:toll/interleukin-1 receptor domain-containing protein [Actinoplanes deccanensis]GID78698.1 hypothetical protein Ade02nite_73390 [Actinoplanes deccanensis]